MGMINRSVELFLQLSKMGIVVSQHVLLKILNSLIDLRNPDALLDVYSEMHNWCGGAQRWCFNFYGFVMNGFLKNGHVEIGLEFHRKLLERV